MDYKHIAVEIKDSVAVITIKREEALNALNAELIGELQGFISHNWMKRDFRCLVITGAGKAFVAGADIRHGGDRAYYNVNQDLVRMPPFETFRDAESHSATLAHELAHWTRHKSRLDRDLPISASACK